MKNLLLTTILFVLGCGAVTSVGGKESSSGLVSTSGFTSGGTTGISTSTGTTSGSNSSGTTSNQTITNGTSSSGSSWGEDAGTTSNQTITNGTSSSGSSWGGDAGWMPGDAGWTETEDGGVNCMPNSTDCQDPSTEAICNSDETSVRFIACPNGCNGTSCDTCQPSLSVCGDGGIVECNADGHSTNLIQVCQYGCNSSTVICYPNCIPNEQKCSGSADGGSVLTCNGAGTSWDATQNCPFGCWTSDAGLSCYQDCFPGTTSCESLALLNYCLSDGTGYSQDHCYDHCGDSPKGSSCDYCQTPADCYLNDTKVPFSGLTEISAVCLDNHLCRNNYITCTPDGGECPVDTVCIDDAGVCDAYTCNPDAGSDAGTCLPFIGNPTYGLLVTG